MLRIHNTLSGKLEEFRPLVEGEVKFYYCGPTVWDYGHIGNFRAAIAADVLRRYLKSKGLRVIQAMNITDVDDRIIAKAQESGKTIDDYTQKYIEAFWDDFDALGCERPEVAPRATKHIPEMVALVKKLMERDHAYQSDGSIYYRIKSFPEYGKLSKINFAGNIEGGSERIDTDRYEKEDARDFALWKEPANENEPAWDTEIGRGRPGWHIECSAMSIQFLGATLDIHAGGVDLIFPHHENEIAQSEALTGKPFANYWLHSEFLLVDGQKMSKSLGNFHTLRDLCDERGFSPESVRYLLASVPYRKGLNFTFEGLNSAHTAIERLRNFKFRLDTAKLAEGTHERLLEHAARALLEFRAAMDDDLNTAEALGAVFEFLREANTALDAGDFLAGNLGSAQALLEQFDVVFEVLTPSVKANGISEQEIDQLIAIRSAAKKSRDF